MQGFMINWKWTYIHSKLHIITTGLHKLRKLGESKYNLTPVSTQYKY